MLVPPIFAYEKGDFLVFADIPAAEGYLEPWAVEEGIEIFDRNGVPVTLYTDSKGGYSKPGKLLPMDEPQPERLRRILLDHLEFIGDQIDDKKNMTLPQLVDFFIENYAEFTNEARECIFWDNLYNTLSYYEGLEVWWKRFLRLLKIKQ